MMKVCSLCSSHKSYQGEGQKNNRQTNWLITGYYYFPKNKTKKQLHQNLCGHSFNSGLLAGYETEEISPQRKKKRWASKDKEFL